MEGTVSFEKPVPPADYIPEYEGNWLVETSLPTDYTTFHNLKPTSSFETSIPATRLYGFMPKKIETKESFEKVGTLPDYTTSHSKYKDNNPFREIGTVSRPNRET
jgi:hypothetical protein